ncbi:unnamed protein product [Effrenium voratum]|uniref:Uncharacterized protein n=1 Tax=Effrenium voratum TaxID=2562239 RepID=A0AA36HLN3_9DINO|nr:unnamed protein product [Effrenium voratum]
MDSSVASELKKLKEDEKLELNVKVSKIMHSLMQQMHLHCDQVLGNMMLKAGVDLSKLDSCICFETAADAGQRSQQLQANMDLVAQSQGKLAPVTGAERYLSVCQLLQVGFALLRHRRPRPVEVLPQRAFELGCLAVQQLLGCGKPPFHTDGQAWLGLEGHQARG